MDDKARQSQHARWVHRHRRYRVNFINPDGTILRTEILDANKDEDAIQAARRLMNGQALDLWDGLRFIESFPRINPPA